MEHKGGNMPDNEQKRKEQVLAFTQLALKALQEELPPDEITEMGKIQAELGLSPEDILAEGKKAILS